MITDWLMIVITGVYVAATIAILNTNKKAVRVTEIQLEESKRQYKETQRMQVMPYFQLDFVEAKIDENIPCTFVEMHNKKNDIIKSQALFSLRNIGLGIAHHTSIFVTTRYKKDDKYPAFDFVMPPNCEKKTYVQFNVEKYVGELGREEKINVRLQYDDVLGNTYTQEAQLIMVVCFDKADLFHVINMKSPQLRPLMDDE